MAKTLKASTTTNMQKAAARNEYIAQGGNDGRFRIKIVEDKRKREDRNKSRKFKQMARQSYMSY